MKWSVNLRQNRNFKRLNLDPFVMKGKVSLVADKPVAASKENWEALKKKLCLAAIYNSIDRHIYNQYARLSLRHFSITPVNEEGNFVTQESPLTSQNFKALELSWKEMLPLERKKAYIAAITDREYIKKSKSSSAVPIILTTIFGVPGMAVLFAFLMTFITEGIAVNPAVMIIAAVAMAIGMVGLAVAIHQGKQLEMAFDAKVSNGIPKLPRAVISETNRPLFAREEFHARRGAEPIKGEASLVVAQRLQ